ncbi:activating transcription factor 7-interacting protein 1 isoform X2 [Amia ocellicauda]|uniref:activating transcription factor 7-interacting protein 1 isoform X2 n=1 Tax=Amia ocellicauda TaxID=2972642 RepID=UPI00346423FB
MMDVAVGEEPQKKVFRARKTMRLSDRSQLDALHRPRPSDEQDPPVAPVLLNGRHPDTKTGRSSPETPGGSRPVAPSSPTVLLSLSLSPSRAGEPEEEEKEPEVAAPDSSPSPSLSADSVKEGAGGRGIEGKLKQAQGPGGSSSALAAEVKEGQDKEENRRRKQDTGREKERTGPRAPSPIILLTPLDAEQRKSSADRLKSSKADAARTAAASSSPRRSPNPPTSAAAKDADEEKGKRKRHCTEREEEEQKEVEGPVAMETDEDVAVLSSPQPSSSATASAVAKEPVLDPSGAIAAASVIPILERFAPPQPRPLSSSSSPLPSEDGVPSPPATSDPEPIEGFLVLSEEEESLGEKEEEGGVGEKREGAAADGGGGGVQEEKERMEGSEPVAEEEKKEEKGGSREGEEVEMDIELASGTAGTEDTATGTAAAATPTPPAPSPPVTTPTPCTPKAAVEPAHTSAEETGLVPQRKRTLSDSSAVEGGSEGSREEVKRPRVAEGCGFEAQLQVKISGLPEQLPPRLEKALQKMVSEQLMVLQNSVFERGLQELRERLDRLDCRHTHEQLLTTLKGKISRLAKRFGAANQAKEDSRKAAETYSSAPTAAVATPTPTPTPNYRAATVRTILESRRADQPSPSTVTSTSTALQPLQMKQPAPNTMVTPVLSIISSAGSTAVASTGPSFSLSSSSSSTSTSSLTLKPTPSPSSGVTTPVTCVTPSNPSSTVVGLGVAGGAAPSSSISLQPVLIHVPLAVGGGGVGGSGGTGLELIPVSAATAVALTASQTRANPVKTLASPLSSSIPLTTSSSSSSIPLTSSSSPSPAVQKNAQLTVPRVTLYGGAAPTSGVTGGSAPRPAPLPLALPVTHAVVGVTAATASSLASSVSGASCPATASFAALVMGGGALPAATGGSGTASKTDAQVTNRAADSTTKPAAQARPSAAGAVIDLTEDDDDVQVTGVQNATPPSTSTSSQQPLGQRTVAPSSAPATPAAPLQSTTTTTTTTTTTMHVLPTAQTTVNVLQRSQNPQLSGRQLGPRAPPPPSTASPLLYSPISGNVGGVRSQVLGNSGRQNSPQTSGVTVRPSSHYVGNGPQLTVHHRPLQDPPPSSTAPASRFPHPAAPLPAPPPPPPPVPASSLQHPAPLPSPPPPPSRLPPEAASTSPPQRPQLKLARVPSQNGIVLSWSVGEMDRSCAAVDSYHLYAYHEEPPAPAPGAAASPSPSQWKKIGEVKALPLPMACTLTQFVSGSKYYFAVRARDLYGRYGPFCEPQSTDVIAS